MKQLPDILINVLQSHLENHNNVWADLNCYWILRKQMIDNYLTAGTICIEDIPDNPDPQDFTDEETPRTKCCSTIYDAWNNP